MPSITLLNAVKDVLSDTGLDEINSISDNVESLMVANFIKGAYYEILELADVPRTLTFFQLDATNASTPTVLSIPETVVQIQSIEYDKRESLTDPVTYGTIHYVTPAEFFRRSNALDEGETNVELISHSSGVTYKVRNDKHPSVYTVYNNKYVLCDSYYSDLDANLQQSKTRVYGETEPVWSVDDAHTIDLDNHLMQLLLQKAKVRTLSRIKGERDAETERSARRLEIRASTTKDKRRAGVKYPDYGRRRP